MLIVIKKVESSVFISDISGSGISGSFFETFLESCSGIYLIIGSVKDFFKK